MNGDTFLELVTDFLEFYENESYDDPDEYPDENEADEWVEQLSKYIRERCA